jgi:hypothetical protein
MTALMLNIAWEWLYAFLDLTVAPGVQGYVNLVWGLADIAIVVTFFRFGFAEFSDLIGRSAFVTGRAGLLGISVAVQLLCSGRAAVLGARPGLHRPSPPRAQASWDRAGQAGSLRLG